jgi:hypothetical protein
MENSSWSVENTLSPGSPAEMSEITRLFGFTRSQAVMRDIVARPSFIVPLVLSTVAAMAFLVVARPQFTWTLNQTIMGASGVAASVAVRTLVIAGMLTAFAALVSRGPVNFGQVFAVVCYSRMPGVAFTVLAIALILLRRASGLPDAHPINPLMTSLAVFLDPSTSSRFVYSIASSVDCVTFWELSLIGLGLRAASQISSTAANVGIVGLWVLSTFAQAAWIQGIGR